MSKPAMTGYPAACKERVVKRAVALEQAIAQTARDPLVVLHTFRFMGLSFLVPGVVSPSLPLAFAAPAAYGDLVVALLAVAATVALSSGRARPLWWCGCSP
jgi:hypothetical protein